MSSVISAEASGVKSVGGVSKATVQPYLFFGGRCEEALAFYREALGATVERVMKYNESPMPPSPDCPMPAGWGSKVMHASFRVGGAAVMASDGNVEGAKFEGFSLALGCTSGDAVERAFAGLAQGGAVVMPLMKTFWSEKFGMVTDRFGVTWMLSVEPAAE